MLNTLLAASNDASDDSAAAVIALIILFGIGWIIWSGLASIWGALTKKKTYEIRSKGEIREK